MDFLMSAFKAFLEDLRYDFTMCKFPTNFTYRVVLYELPMELDYQLSILEIELPPVTTELKVKRASNRVVTEYPKEKVVDNMFRDKNKGNALEILFTKDNYAAKINKIKCCIMKYNEENMR